MIAAGKGVSLSHRTSSERRGRVVTAEAPRFPSLSEAFFREEKWPVFRSLSIYLARLHGAGRLRVPDPEIAAAQFLGRFKEALVWPRLLGVSRLVDADEDAIIAEAARTFVARWGANPVNERSTGSP